jgi:cytoskeletal protein RodZ
MASFGEELRRERELRDISLREISDATNIPVRSLEALERNEFHILPGGIYVRGFVRSFANHIGLDPEETLNAFQQEVERQQAMHGDGPYGFAQPAPGEVGRIGESVIVIAFVAVTALIGVIYWAGGDSRTTLPEPDPAAHGAALRARVKKSGALPSHPSVETDQAAATAEPPEPPSPLPASPGATAPERLVGIRALETTRVQLTCAGVVAFKAEMWVGVERQFPCREPILLSATNGGAVEYSVDASGLRPLGEEGEIVRDRPIPFEDPSERSARAVRGEELAARPPRQAAGISVEGSRRPAP